MRILEQAFEYLSIDDDKKEKILETVDKKGAENPDASLLDLLTADDLVSEDELEYFKIFDEYLKTQDLDQQFGEIAVANHFTSQKAVDLAFEHQRQYFEKYRINTSIGDVLLEDEAITRSDRISILHTQNRINDDQLLDALNSLGNTISQ